AAALTTQPWRATHALSTPSTVWQPAPSLPFSTQEVYGTVWSDELLVAGGLRSGADTTRRFTTLAQTARFDPATETWSTGPDLPDPRHHIVLATVGDTAYGFGGFVGENLDQDGFQFRDDVYAFGGDEWTRIGSLPTPLGETVSLSVDGRIHLVTGSLHGDDTGPTGRHLVYDPEADAWDTARPAPTARSSATGAVIDGRLYVAGGRTTQDGVTNLGALERYDPESDTWTELRPLPQPSGGLNGAATGGTLYVFGGEYFSDGGGVFAETWAYDPATDDWTEGPAMPTPRHGLAGVALDGRIYAVGGNRAPGIGAATSTAVEVLVPAAD
ncbi:MAG: Kelch repeat-containing protein, partial [Salinivenus sp.]